MQKLTTLSKWMLGVIAIGSSFGAVHTYGKSRAASDELRRRSSNVTPAPSSVVRTKTSSLAPGDRAVVGSSRTGAPLPIPGERPLRIALSQWPGHMALLVGAGGLRTMPGSLAAAEGLDLELRFIEDAPTKNAALLRGEVDFVWQTVDELPIGLAAYRRAGMDVRAFMQLDWSRGGDACVASSDVLTVEGVYGRRSAMLLFSPDHTVFEFMINNSRLSHDQVAEVRRATRFSPDDPTFARALFTAGKVDVACLWEPDVTLALEGRPGSHRLFSTADATELIADVLVARQDYLQTHEATVAKLARLWFRSVEQANRDRPHAANLIATVASRFRDELGYEKTLASLAWAKWTSLADNVRFFGLDGAPPAFDRVYEQADAIWVGYPQAEIKERFAPAALRNDGAIRSIWVAAGKPIGRVASSFDPAIASNGSPLFTKPVTIAFPSKGDELSAEAIAVINRQILPQLEIAGGMSVRVEGNTDSVGERAANQDLSERRALAIVQYLIARGVPKNRLVARGNGSGKPVAPNATAEGRAQNRRTDVLFIRGVN